MVSMKLWFWSQFSTKWSSSKFSSCAQNINKITDVSLFCLSVTNCKSSASCSAQQWFPTLQCGHSIFLQYKKKQKTVCVTVPNSLMSKNIILKLKPFVKSLYFTGSSNLLISLFYGICKTATFPNVIKIGIVRT